MLVTHSISRPLSLHTTRICRYLCTNESSSKLSLSSIRSRLSKFKGGEVTLTSSGANKNIALINVSNPRHKNAFTGSMCISLYDCIHELAGDTTWKAVIVRGLDRMFCSGADLNMARQIADSESGEQFSYFMQTTLSNLRNLPLPSFALLQGNVLGGGAELAVACDLTIAHPNTSIYFIQAKMGIVPGWGGATHLVNKVGYHRALQILLSADRVSSGRAHSIGLVDHLLNLPQNCDASLSDDKLLEKSLDIIDNQFAQLPVEVVRAAKSVAINASQLAYSDSISHERYIFKSLWGGPANLEALESNLKHVK
ncbi:ethylmalonyl-CoA decarboxylase-like [Watersipora subatra]|uniref:ethylmalonyl-CoA decarboxylase-like n=1 Tax=Watersipora subatra TaxID=2589382 RepID=UPI00355B341C